MKWSYNVQGLVLQTLKLGLTAFNGNFIEFVQSQSRVILWSVKSHQIETDGAWKGSCRFTDSTPLLLWNPFTKQRSWGSRSGVCEVVLDNDWLLKSWKLVFSHALEAEWCLSPTWLVWEGLVACRCIFNYQIFVLVLINRVGDSISTSELKAWRVVAWTEEALQILSVPKIWNTLQRCVFSAEERRLF